jgi:hypothetical protein
VSSSSGPSKRERQKQRRNEKLQQQAAAEARSRRTRVIAFVALGVVFLGLVGVAVAQQQADKRAEEQQAAEVAANLEELGCTPDETLEDDGQGHLDGAALAQQPPETLYADRPAGSGQHYGNWLMTGVYDQLLDERALVHNLEHGYVIGYYDDSADEAGVSALKEYAQSAIDGDYKKIIVAPWDGELEGDANFAYVAWNQRQQCADFDDATFEQFLKNHHSGNGEAPEKTLTAHLAEGNGTIDPGNEPFLLPPLGEDAPASESMDDGAADEATESSS